MGLGIRCWYHHPSPCETRFYHPHPPVSRCSGTPRQLFPRSSGVRPSSLDRPRGGWRAEGLSKSSPACQSPSRRGGAFEATRSPVALGNVPERHLDQIKQSGPHRAGRPRPRRLVACCDTSVGRGDVTHLLLLLGFGFGNPGTTGLRSGKRTLSSHLGVLFFFGAPQNPGGRRAQPTTPWEHKKQAINKAEVARRPLPRRSRFASHANHR